MTAEQFAQNTLKSNSILINGKLLEEWMVVRPGKVIAAMYAARTIVEQWSWEVMPMRSFRRIWSPRPDHLQQRNYSTRKSAIATLALPSQMEAAVRNSLKLT